VAGQFKRKDDGNRERSKHVSADLGVLECARDFSAKDSALMVTRAAQGTSAIVQGKLPQPARFGLRRPQFREDGRHAEKYSNG
jgi:hypothetical protein